MFNQLWSFSVSQRLLQEQHGRHGRCGSSSSSALESAISSILDLFLSGPLLMFLSGLRLLSMVEVVAGLGRNCLC